MSKTKYTGPKILLLDIETAPLLASVWALFDQNVGLNQIEKEWHLLSFSAKWLEDGPEKIIYHDQRNVRNIENDKGLLQKIWKLLDDADVVITQNGKKFDIKKINARLIMHNMQPPSSFKQIDTLVLAKKHFSFTSNKLEWMTSKLCRKYKKLSHKKFSGFSLWKECIAGNLEAWEEMEVYNKMDVLSLQELYYRLIPWDNNTVNFNIYSNNEDVVCKCGSTDFMRKGFSFTSTAKYQRYRCKKCGAETRDSKNLLNKEKRDSLRRGTNR